jgi:cob(I)alamin adenosyltransferase
MRITKVYTKTGDKGTTALVGGTRVLKNHPRIDAYGTVDELNSILGLILSFAREDNGFAKSLDIIETSILRIQNHLFNVGADLATLPEHRWVGMIRVGNTDVGWLESEIDRLNESLPPLKEFILPGGGIISSFCHQARTVCRRGERNCLFLLDDEEETGVITYLNRLSDYLFVLGRWVAKEKGESETFWSREISKSPEAT